jgi:thiamine-phosphate pyrophosphorylase
VTAPGFRLLLVSDWERPDALARLDDALAAGGPVAVQHRHPGATDRRFFDEGLALADVCARRGVPLFVNGRLDVARALGAHLHLPTRAVAPADARPHVAGWLSAAWHPAEEPEPPRGVDLLVAAPVFAPGSKPGDARPRLGVEGFHRARTLAAPVPVFALGGVDERSLGGLREAGPVAGVAVITAVLAAPSPARAVEALLRALGL